LYLAQQETPTATKYSWPISLFFRTLGYVRNWFCGIIYLLFLYRWNMETPSGASVFVWMRTIKWTLTWLSWGLRYVLFSILLLMQTSVWPMRMKMARRWILWMIMISMTWWNSNWNPWESMYMGVDFFHWNYLNGEIPSTNLPLGWYWAKMHFCMVLFLCLGLDCVRLFTANRKNRSSNPSNMLVKVCFWKLGIRPKGSHVRGFNFIKVMAGLDSVNRSCSFHLLNQVYHHSREFAGPKVTK